ncbi:MAG: hypothetical protein QGH47_05165 [Candidatus Woesearchaeota archaeon]|nr:hypothetical protein [Candidatus Woesearchaeota archaeon]
MLYESRDKILTGKVKKCVYCGRNFSVKNCIVKQVGEPLKAADLNG